MQRDGARGPPPRSVRAILRYSFQRVRAFSRSVSVPASSDRSAVPDLRLTGANVAGRPGQHYPTPRGRARLPSLPSTTASALTKTLGHQNPDNAGDWNGPAHRTESARPASALVPAERRHIAMMSGETVAYLPRSTKNFGTHAEAQPVKQLDLGGHSLMIRRAGRPHRASRVRPGDACPAITGIACKCDDHHPALFERHLVPGARGPAGPVIARARILG